MGKKKNRFKDRNKRSSIGESCFVLMPFGLPFDRYYQNIFEPAITSLGLNSIRADSLFRSSPIMVDIWRFVRESRVLLADLSGKNPNVFYELGLAHAIGKPVILVSTAIEDIPFDLRGLRVLIYDKDNENWGSDLKKRIQKSLKETIADINSAVPPMFLESHHISRPIEDPQTKELREIRNEIRALRSERTSKGSELIYGLGEDSRAHWNRFLSKGVEFTYGPNEGFVAETVTDKKEPDET
jgi:hypothetical protein